MEGKFQSLTVQERGSAISYLETLHRLLISNVSHFYIIILNIGEIQLQTPALFSNEFTRKVGPITLEFYNLLLIGASPTISSDFASIKISDSDCTYATEILAVMNQLIEQIKTVESLIEGYESVNWEVAIVGKDHFLIGDLTRLRNLNIVRTYYDYYIQASIMTCKYILGLNISQLPN